MRIGYLECFAGISGDMLMGALVDAGAPVELLQRTTASLNLGADLRVSRVSRSGIQSTKIDVLVQGKLHEPAAATGPIEHEHDHHDHQHGHKHEHPTPHHEHEHGRNLAQIRSLLMSADLTERARSQPQRL
jgi:uncharacterized protein (DUF111 family)